MLVDLAPPLVTVAEGAGLLIGGYCALIGEFVASKLGGYTIEREDIDVVDCLSPDGLNQIADSLTARGTQQHRGQVWLLGTTLPCCAAVHRIYQSGVSPSLTRASIWTAYSSGAATSLGAWYAFQTFSPHVHATLIITNIGFEAVLAAGLVVSNAFALGLAQRHPSKSQTLDNALGAQFGKVFLPAAAMVIVRDVIILSLPTSTPLAIPYLITGGLRALWAVAAAHEVGTERSVCVHYTRRAVKVLREWVGSKVFVFVSPVCRSDPRGPQLAATAKPQASIDRRYSTLALSVGGSSSDPDPLLPPRFAIPVSMSTAAPLLTLLPPASTVGDPQTRMETVVKVPGTGQASSAATGPSDQEGWGEEVVDAPPLKPTATSARRRSSRVRYCSLGEGFSLGRLFWWRTRPPPSPTRPTAEGLVHGGREPPAWPPDTGS